MPEPAPEADDLYELPPEEFIRARNDLAKRLKAEGRREEAEAVRQLRKPTVAAWALNQAARTVPESVEALLAAGAGLRQAHDEALRGDVSGLKAAGRAEQEAVAGALARAERVLRDAGRSAEPQRDRLRDTLRAAAIDDELGKLLRAGRIVEEAAPVGFGAVPAGFDAAEAKVTREVADRRRTDRAEKHLASLEAEYERLAERAAKARRDADSAARSAEEARRRADEAEERLSEAERARDAAREELTDLG